MYTSNIIIFEIHFQEERGGKARITNELTHQSGRGLKRRIRYEYLSERIQRGGGTYSGKSTVTYQPASLPVTSVTVPTKDFKRSEKEKLPDIATAGIMV
jgi:hypothetical protein